MRRQQIADDGQAHAGSTGFPPGGEEGVENPPRIACGNSGAVIGNVKPRSPRQILDRQGQRLRPVIGSIAQQMPKNDRQTRR